MAPDRVMVQPACGLFCFPKFLTERLECLQAANGDDMDNNSVALRDNKPGGCCNNAIELSSTTLEYSTSEIDSISDEHVPKP